MAARLLPHGVLRRCDRLGVLDDAHILDASCVDVSDESVLFPGQGDRATTGAGVELWGLYNAYLQGQPGGNGDTFTPGGRYELMTNQAGVGRDLADRSAFQLTQASASVYPGRLGTVSVPTTTGSARLFYNEGVDRRLNSFMMLHLSPWVTTRGNTASEWSLIRGGTSGILVKLAWSDGAVFLDWDGNVGAVGPSIPLPNTGDDAAVDDWVLMGLACSSSGPGGVDTYRMVVVSSIGEAGPILNGDESFSSSAPLEIGESTNNRRSSWRGVINGGDGEKPLAAFYTGPDSADFGTDFVDACVAAVVQRDPSVAAAVRTLL